MVNDFAFVMQKFENYPVSSCYSQEDKKFIVVDDKQSFPRFTSNDSGISFGESDNDSIFSDECEFDIDQNYIQQPITITNDGIKYKIEINILFFFYSSFSISYI
jgi:hypothetical protein